MNSSYLFSKLNARFLAFAIVILWGCASRQPFPETILNTPELYVSNGFKLIQKGRCDDAEREFNKAIRHDPRNSDAFAGLALTMGCRGQAEAALNCMKRSASFAKTEDEEYRVLVGWVRLHTVLKGEDWLSESEKAYSRASSMLRDSPEAYYYIGLAYKQGYRIQEARGAFLRVLEIRKALLREARDEIGILKKIESAKPISETGRKLVLKERINRAEMAALFVHELGLREILGKGARGEQPAQHALRPVADLIGHPMRRSVEAVLPLNIKGLSISEDETFGPNEIVTRSAYSVMLADIISKAVNDPTLVSRHAGKSSPYLDVKNDASYLGAIQVCIAWGGGLQAEQETFDPMGVLSGCDALLSLQKIRDKLTSS